MTGFIEHVRSLARLSEGAKSARDMRSLAHKRKMWVTVRVENPQLKPAFLSLFAISNSSGQVLGDQSGFSPAFFSASRLIHVTTEDELNGKDNISPVAVE